MTRLGQWLWQQCQVGWWDLWHGTRYEFYRVLVIAWLLVGVLLYALGVIP
jgi:hypothetical protein